MAARPKRTAPKNTAPHKSTPRHIALGRSGEEAAARHLERLGWALLDRNWRPQGPARGLELDIVARHGDTLVFVEVKTRATATGTAARPALAVPVHAALTAPKRARLARAASRYLTLKQAWHIPCRFDLICIEYDPDGRQSLEHFTDVIETGHLVDSSHTSWQPW